MAVTVEEIYTYSLTKPTADRAQKINKDCRRSAVFAVFCDLLNLGETIVLSDIFLYYCLLWLYYIVILPVSKIKKTHACVQNSSCSRTAEFVEQVTNVTRRTIFIVGEGFDDNGSSANTVTLVNHIFIVD